MITDTILLGLTAIVVGLLEVLPDWTAPSWATDNTVVNAATTVGTYAGQLGYWVPWTLITSIVVSVVGLYASVVGIKFVLWAWSKIPIIGGGE